MVSNIPDLKHFLSQKSFHSVPSLPQVWGFYDGLIMVKNNPDSLNHEDNDKLLIPKPFQSIEVPLYSVGPI